MKIFCSGIGGIGLSAYGAHMKMRGHNVSGSDRAASALTDDLIAQEIPVSFLQDGSALPDHLDLLVYSEAIPETASERRLAKERGIRQISYFRALGEMTSGTKLIAVAGTHGKSSTTAMATRTLVECDMDPNVVVGTKLKELHGRNWRTGASEWWVVEACEYRCSFHYLSPAIILLTNADGDHFDAFPTRQSYEEAFITFLKRLPADGVVITHGNDPQICSIVERANVRMIDCDDEEMITLKTPGKHMRSNAQLVLALARYLGLPMDKASKALSGFSGSWRRMEIKGSTMQGALIIDDYAHHPVEIRATLSALREQYVGKRIVCAFQPHTHDRTLKLWSAFAEAFKDADSLLLIPVYDARPAIETQKVDEELFANDIARASDITVTRAESLDEASLKLADTLQQNDVLVTMGAGSITQLSDMMMNTSKI